MQVLKNVYQVYGNVYSNINNIFIVKGQDGLVIFDTGENQKELAVIDENIRYWGLDQYPITHVFISHKHFGHIGNAAVFRERGAKIVAGIGDAEEIEQGDLNAIRDIDPFPIRDTYIPCKVDIVVKDGDIVHAAGMDFEAIHVPGHTNGSMFYQTIIDGKIVLFTGDVLNVGPDCQSALLGWMGGEDYNREVYFASIKRFSKLPCDIILPAHHQLCMQEGWKVLQGAYAKALIDWQTPAVKEE